MKKVLSLVTFLLIGLLTACGGEVAEVLVEQDSVSDAPAQVEEVAVEESAVEETMLEEADEMASAVAIDSDGYYRLTSKFMEDGHCLESNGGPNEGSVLGGATFMNSCQEVTGQLWKFIPAGDGYYHLTSMFMEGEGKRLESNGGPNEGSVLGGATFINTSQEVTGQFWKLTESGEAGYYRLTSKFMEDGHCLESNGGPNEGSVLGGATFINSCQDVTGQLWKLISADMDADTGDEMAPDMGVDTDSYYRLTSMFMEDGHCLESNGGPNEGSVLGGATFMNSCQEVTGQLWKFIPAGDGYYHLTSMFMEGEGKRLESNGGPNEGSVLGGATFINTSQEVTGQFWKLIESDEAGYYHLTSKFMEDGHCLESNGGPNEGSILGGATFIDSCQNVTGQYWKLIPEG